MHYFTGTHSFDAGKSYIRQNWTLGPIDWIQINTDVLKAKVNQMTAISYVCEIQLGA